MARHKIPRSISSTTARGKIGSVRLSTVIGNRAGGVTISFSEKDSWGNLSNVYVIESHNFGG